MAECEASLAFFLSSSSSSAVGIEKIGLFVGAGLGVGGPLEDEGGTPCPAAASSIPLPRFFKEK